MRIRVAAVEKKDAPFQFRDVEMDEPRSDEVLVRVVATGICHTDAHIRAQGYETPLPLVLGHEGAGIVERVGADVGSVVAGDRVVMSFPSCGHCMQCFAGHPAYCDQNLRLSFGVRGASPSSGPLREGLTYRRSRLPWWKATTSMRRARGRTR
jgi:aryl-alcohol dehydrogenase